jgi:peptidyl-tRNA hydrolase
MTAVLYILMRNDLNSMNAGKGMAQASHASNAFVHHCDARIDEMNKNFPASKINEVQAFTSSVDEWKNSTKQGFGTVLVLEAKMNEIYPVVEVFEKIGYVAGVVHDPTYPIVDGEVVHFIPLDTCAYVFVPNKEADQVASMLLKKFPLHR